LDALKPGGRTIGDALLEILTSWKLLLTLFGFLLVAFVFIVNDSEPGSPIDFFGLKYQRAKPVHKVADQDPTADYIFPRGETFSVGRERATPILDGTIAIDVQTWRSIYSNQKPRLVGGAITGANIGQLKVGSRTVDGRTQTLFRAYKHQDRVLFRNEAYIEVEFKGAYFSLISEPSGSDAFKVSVARLKRPTLELVLVSELPEESPGSD
jgi:hypothetical protein